MSYPSCPSGEGPDVAAWCESYAATVPTERLVRMFWRVTTAKPKRRRRPRNIHERRLAISDAALVREIARRR